MLRKRSGDQSPVVLPVEGLDTGVLGALHAPTSPTVLLAVGQVSERGRWYLGMDSQSK